MKPTSFDCLEKVHHIHVHNNMIAYSLEHSIQVVDNNFQLLHSYQTGSSTIDLKWSPVSGTDLVLSAAFLDRVVLFHNHQVFELTKSPTNRISFNSNGSLLASTGDDKLVHVFHLQEDGEQETIVLRSRGVALEWNAHKSSLLIGESSGEIRVFDFHSKQFVYAVMQPYFGQLLRSLSWHLSDTSSFGGLVGDKWFIWNLEKGHLPEHQGYAPNGRQFLWTGVQSKVFCISSNNELRLYPTVFTKGI
jgi:WD40 repeat protein